MAQGIIRSYISIQPSAQVTSFPFWLTTHTLSVVLSSLFPAFFCSIQSFFFTHQTQLPG